MELFGRRRGVCVVKQVKKVLEESTIEIVVSLITKLMAMDDYFMYNDTFLFFKSLSLSLSLSSRSRSLSL